MYAGRVACFVVSYGECADNTDGRTDGRHTVTLRFPLDAASVKNVKMTEVTKFQNFLASLFL